MAKKLKGVNALDVIAAMPAERRERIEAGAAKILEEMHLGELRKAMKTAQTVLAERTGMKQAEISRIENNPATVQLKTIERYVSGLGGELKITAVFPDGTEASIPVSHGKLAARRMMAEKARKEALREFRLRSKKAAQPKLKRA